MTKKIGENNEETLNQENLESGQENQTSDQTIFSEAAFLERIENSPELKSGYIASGPSIATNEEIELVVNYLIEEKKLPKNQDSIERVRLNMAILLHGGATSPKSDKNKFSSFWRLTLTVRSLENAVHKVPGLTTRKVARGMRNEINSIALRLNMPGNLSKRYRMEHPTAEAKELVWAADYNTFSENPSIPENVKIWLAENLKKRYE